MIGLADTVAAYEAGDLDEEATVALFQRLLNDGTAWTLQGHYGRMTIALLDQGRLSLPDYMLAEV